MYQNNQLDLLINAYEGSIPPNVAQVSIELLNLFLEHTIIAGR